MALNGGYFRRLVFQGIQTMHIADQRTDGGNQQRHPERHREHLTDRRRLIAAQQMPGRRGADKQRATEKRRHCHMQ